MTRILINNLAFKNYPLLVTNVTRFKTEVVV